RPGVTFLPEPRRCRMPAATPAPGAGSQELDVMTTGTRRSAVFTILFVIALLVTASTGPSAETSLLEQARSVFKPLPKTMPAADNPLTPEKVALGRMLFFDPRVSLDGTVSCSRCHQPGLYSTDALRKPIGALHRENPRNAPVIFNAALQIA